VNTVIWVLNEN